MYKGSVGLVVGIPVLCCSSEAKRFLEFAVGDGGEESLAAASANSLCILCQHNLLQEHPGNERTKGTVTPCLTLLEQSKLQEHKFFSIYFLP